MSGQEGEVKLIFLGDSAVGKSSFIAKMCKLCSPPVGPTITPAYSTVKLHLPSERAQHIAVWDTAGQEKFRTMLPMYYRSANAAIIMYDVTDRKTFEVSKVEPFIISSLKNARSLNRVLFLSIYNF